MSGVSVRQPLVFMQMTMESSSGTTMNKYLFSLFFVWLSPLLQAEIYRWVDDNGRVHFSDSPVNKHQTEKVEVDHSRNSYGGGSVLERQRGLLEDYQQRDQQQAREARKEAWQKSNEERLKRNCLAAKDSLKRYEGSALYYLDDKGERVFYSDDERAKYLKKYRQQVAQNCN